MKILHILGEHGFGGGENQLVALLAHLAARGHENRLVLQPGAGVRSAAEEHAVSVDEVPMRNALDPLAVRALRRHIHASEPDLVHLACSRAHKLGAFATAFGNHPPLVVTRRIDRPLRRGAFSRWLYARAVQATVVISEAVRAQVVRAGVPPDTVHLIHDGVDVERFANVRANRAKARRELALRPEAQVIVCAATLGANKGHRHLLAAFGQLTERFPGARLVLAGTGPERDPLQQEIARRALESRVSLPGQLVPETFLAAADIACLPSLREGLSVFSLEAQAAGLPVVASRVGGLPESVEDGVSGLLVPPGDEAALAGALERLLADADLSARMGAAGRQRVREHFDVREMAARTERLYERIVADANSGG